MTIRLAPGSPSAREADAQGRAASILARATTALGAAIERALRRDHSLADAALDECRSECLFAQSWLRAAQIERNNPTSEPPPCAECGTNLVRGACPKPELHR